MKNIIQPHPNKLLDKFFIDIGIVSKNTHLAEIEFSCKGVGSNSINADNNLCILGQTKLYLLLTDSNFLVTNC